MTTRRSAVSFLPTTAVLELTYACNHRCIFCSCPWEAPDGSFARHAEMDLDAWKDLIAELCRRGVNNLAFTGGEPTLKPGWQDLIRFAADQETIFIETKERELVERRSRPELFLLSNGECMDRDTVELCASLGIALSMSLPGLDTFAEHTGGRHDPQRVLDWFGKAQAKGVTTTAGITVTARNIHELERTVGTALLSGADRVLLNRFLPGGRGLAHRQALDLTPDQVVQAFDATEGILRQANRRGNVGTEVPRCLVDGSRYTHLEVSHGCSAARGFFVVDPSGYIRVCNHSPVRLLHWTKMDELRTDPYWRRFALGDYLPQACTGCREIGQCGGGCREAAHICGGAVDAPDPCVAPRRLLCPPGGPG
jgi:radical SAM protein with 4Fe4S-binding SPASM domain